MQNECSVNACCAAAPLHLMYFWLWLCPSCVQVLGRQVKGAWWQNAWCVAYFPGFDLPWMQRCEENEDELEHGGCPIAGEREDELMDIKCLLCFLFLFCPFLCLTCAISSFCPSQFHSNGVFEVSSRFTGRFRTNSWLLFRTWKNTTKRRQTKHRTMDYSFQRTTRFHLNLYSSRHDGVCFTRSSGVRKPLSLPAHAHIQKNTHIHTTCSSFYLK